MSGEPPSAVLPELGRFKDALHTSFRIEFESGEHADLTLVAVEVGDARPGWERFSLLFTGPPASAHWQDTCTVRHPSLGSFPLFLVAVITEEGDQRYEAVFHRRL